MLKVGLTGGIGSGKSTVTDLFAERGIPIIDMDIIARQVVMPGEPALEEIKNIFGEDICLETGELDRKKLRKIIFDDNEKRKQLEAIVHPRIRMSVDQQLKQLTEPYCIIVIPLLFETDRQDSVDRVLVIDSTVDEQIKRTCRRDNIDEEYVSKIIANQVDRQTRLDKADDIIHNTNDISSLSTQVNRLHQQYLELSSKFQAI